MKILPATREAYELLHKGAACLADIESAGMRVDMGYLDTKIAETKAQITENQRLMRESSEFKVWKKRFGNKTNLDSKKQLGAVMFESLGHKRQKENKKNDEAAFSHIRKDSPFIQAYFINAKLDKAQGTYLTGIKREAEFDGKYWLVRPFFNLNTVRTYRSSADRPNFQNIPIRIPEIAKLVRSAFIPRKNHQIIESDFAGAEVRVSACYNKDPTLIEYILDKTKDMHRDMAAQCYKLHPKRVSKQARYCGKNMFVFPQFYGDAYQNNARAMWEAIGEYGLDNGKGLSMYEHLERKGIDRLGACDFKEDPIEGTFEHHLRSVQQDFWGNRFRVYAQWKKEWWQSYLKKGFIQMFTGFVVQGIYSRNDIINYPVQGAAFHCLLWSLIQLHKWMKKNKMKSKIVGQIHDSVVTDGHVKEREDYLAKAWEIMTVDLPKHWDWIIVPIEAEMEVAAPGASWYDKQKVEIAA